MIAALYDAPLPPLRGSEFTSTQFDFVPVAMILVALALYLWGVQRNNALHPRHRWSVGQDGGFPRRSLHDGGGDLQLRRGL